MINAWWTALGSSVYEQRHQLQQGEGSGPGISLASSITNAWDGLSWTQKLLLFGVSLWGTRLSYRIGSRGVRRYHSGKGNDDARYLEAKSQPGFWKTAYWKLYFPEAIFQTLIALPFTVPFRSGGNAIASPAAYDNNSHGLRDIARAVGVAVFGIGFALETIADEQLVYHHKKHRSGLVRNGVWSIVRHPKYVFHFPFPLVFQLSLEPTANSLVIATWAIFSSTPHLPFSACLTPSIPL